MSPSALAGRSRWNRRRSDGVRRSADRVRVTAQLVSTLDGAQRWSNTYDAKFDDVLTVQDAIASNLARALEVAVGTMATSDRRSEPPEAYDLFMQGKQALDTISKEGCERAIGLFNQVLQSDPMSTRALVSLARIYNVLGDEGWMPPKNAFGQSRHFLPSALWKLIRTTPVHTLHSPMFIWSTIGTGQQHRMNSILRLS